MNRLLPFLFATALLALASVASLAYGAEPAAAPAARQPATAAQLDTYLATKGSPMTGQGAAFVASGGRWQVDPRLLVAIAGAESSFGQITCAPFNAWGYGCPNGPYEFESWADGIDTVMQGLRTNYLAEGRTTVALVHQKYAPVGAANDPTGLNNNWTINVSRFIVELGGDPNDLDMDGIAGSIALGPLGGAPIDEFGFAEEPATEGVAGTGTNVGVDPDDRTVTPDTLEVTAGEPRPLVVRVRNTGSATWRTADVRLRRVDLEPRVVGAPYGALASADSVEPNEVAEFVVQLAAAGASDGVASTAWRLEGPSGPFGSELERDVRFAVPAFVAEDPRVDVTQVGDVIAGTLPIWNVVVHVRNAGSATWQREGDEGVLLGLRRGAGTVEPLGWVNAEVPARLLEREVAPGEDASFAFRVRATDATLDVQPFRPSGWAAGDAITVALGAGAGAPTGTGDYATDEALVTVG